MSEKSSSMSPKRLFILLFLAALLMWVFSEGELESDNYIDNDKVEKVSPLNDELEKEIKLEKINTKEIKVKKKPRKKTQNKQQVEIENESDYLKKRELNYNPNSRNKK